MLCQSEQTLKEDNENSTRVSWTESEIDLIKKSIRECGKDWVSAAAQIRTKSQDECREFYCDNKYSLNLNKILKEYLTNSGKSGKTQDSESDDYWNDISDGDSEETSSAEEGNDRNNSDTASASSPINKTNEDIDNNLKLNLKFIEKAENTITSAPNHSFREGFNKLQDYKGLSASQNSLKSDYDSSATASADEGQGNGDNDRLSSSPAVSLPPRANSAMPVFPPSNNIYYQHVDKHVRPASHDAAFAVDMMSKSSPHHTPSVLRTSESNSINSRQKVPPFLINPNAPSAQQSNSCHVQDMNKGEGGTCVRVFDISGDRNESSNTY